MRLVAPNHPVFATKREICRPCEGGGLLPTSLKRSADDGMTIHLLVQCPLCEGQGVTLPPGDKDLMST